MICSFCNQAAVWSFFHRLTHNRFYTCAKHQSVCEQWRARDSAWDREALK